MFEVDCERCKYYENDSYCSECEHWADLSDWYTPLSDKELAQWEAVKVKKIKRELTFERIEVAADEIFINDYMVASKFTDKVLNRNNTFVSVYIGKDAILASDTRKLIEIKNNNIPEELKDKFVIDREENVFSISERIENSPFKTGAFLEVLNDVDGFTKVTGTKQELFNLFNIIVPWEKCESKHEESYLLELEGKRLYFKKQYIDDIFSVFKDGEQLTIFYKDGRNKILITNETIRCITLPYVIFND